VTKHLIKLASIIAAASVLGATVRAQDAPKGPVPLRLQVVISKYQGDKKISSLPYTVSVNSDRARASLRMGGQVPIVTTVTVGQGAEAKQQPSVQYKDVGTSIDVFASVVDETRYRLDLTIEDSSVYTESTQANTLRAGDHPAFRSFRSSDTLILKDGQSAQYTTATDKISGEVVKVDVTLTVVK
jgi:type II secretory pathway component GspD/PulD (secretin)